MIIKKYKKLDYDTKDLESLSNSDLKKIADYELRNLLLRLGAREFDGLIRCPIRKQWYQKDRMQVAHFFDRHILSLRWDLFNCHLITKDSNEYDSKIMVEGCKSKHHQDYENWLKDEYGDGIIEILESKIDISKPFTKQMYIDTIINFRKNA
jgi:hypothetical protein